MGTRTDLKPRYEGLKVTREEYLSLEDDGFQYDMIGGVLHVSPSATYDHGKANSRFAQILWNWLDKNSMGEVTQEVDLFLPDGGDKLRPDLSFILKENLQIIKGHIHGTPDLVCEVLSESTADRDLGEKAERYRTNGVREYWIVDPRNRSLRLWISRGDQWEKKESKTLASELLPGFVVEAEKLFR